MKIQKWCLSYFWIFLLLKDDKNAEDNLGWKFPGWLRKKKEGTGSGWLVKMGHQSTLPEDVCFKSWDMYVLGFPGGSVVKNLPAKQETRVWTLGWEDTLGEEVATHSSNLAGKIPCTEEPGRLQSMGSQRVSALGITKRRRLKV